MSSAALKTFAFTEESGSYPAFVNLSRHADGSVVIIVRSEVKDGVCGGTAQIRIANDKWAEAVEAVA